MVSGLELLCFGSILRHLISWSSLPPFSHQQPTPSSAVRKTNSSKKYLLLTNHQNKIATVFWPFLQNTSLIKSSALPSNCYHANKMNPSVVKRSLTAHQSFFQCIILSLTCSPPLHPAAPLAHAPTTTLCTKVILLLFYMHYSRLLLSRDTSLFFIIQN